MSNRNRKNYMIDFVFTLSLFGVFAVSALLVVVIGANVYRSTVNTQEANAIKRTSLAYVAEKIRQNDEADNISLSDVEGIPALKLDSVYANVPYSTYIYAYENSLRELLIRGSGKPTLIAGQFISEVSDFSIEQLSDNLYLVSSTDMDGETLSLYINTKSV